MADDAKILRARALALARPPEPPADASRNLEVLEFTLGREHYAIETAFVREVYPLAAMTRVPCTPPVIAGIVNVRGRIVALVDFKKLLGLPEQGLTDLHRVILLEGEQIQLGLVADAAVGVRHLDTQTIQQIAETLAGAHSECLRGVTPEGVIVLDAKRILEDSRIVVDEEVEL